MPTAAINTNIIVLVDEPELEGTVGGGEDAGSSAAGVSATETPSGVADGAGASVGLAVGAGVAVAVVVGTAVAAGGGEVGTASLGSTLMVMVCREWL